LNRQQFTRYPRSGSPQAGVVFPQTAFFGGAEGIRTFATTVEQLGFQHVIAYDHVLGASKATRPDWSGPYSSDDPFQEPFVLFAFMAAVAPTLEFATGVLILPQRQTALVAKQAANVDLLSGGTFRLGVGVGWNPVEYEGLNEEFSNRGKRYSEQIDLIRELTSHDVIDYTGKWHRIDHAGIRPLGIQRPLPIWIGGSAEVAVRRAARIADGFFVNGTSLDRCEASLAILRDELERQGRDELSYGIETRVSVVNNDPDAWKRDFAHWRETQVSHISLVTLGADFAEFEQHTERLAAAKRVWDEM
jgi:probable F420-dependent oxidoreductase